MYSKTRCCDSTFPVPDFPANNPNITVIPIKYTNTNQITPSLKRRPVSSVFQVSRVIPVSCKAIVDQTVIKSPDTKEIQNNCKRVVSSQISNRPVKLPRLSTTKSPNICIDKSAGLKIEKSTAVCQPSSLQEVKKCIECNVLSVQDVCSSYRRNSQSKRVAVTLTGTPRTHLNEDDSAQLISNDDEDNIEPDMQPNKKPVATNRVIYEELKLTNPTIDGKPAPVISIADYKMLTIEQYMNDILIDFYLKYTYYRKLSVEDQERTHIFDTFLYASLKRDSKTNKGYMTKKVNIFEKDFLVVPINENAHWFMAVICFPYLTGPVYMDDGTPVPKEEWDRLDQSSSRNYYGEDIKNFVEGSSNISGVDYQTYLRNSTKINGRPIKQPCILIFDSLCGGIERASVVARLRKWLIDEYRRKYNGTDRDFSPNVVKGGLIRVPQQDNSSDCGLFLMEYFEKFYERPILDYRFPIRHLGNWFHPDDVSSACRKRREVQRIILNLMNEQGVVLPPGYRLPTINFGSNQFSTLSLYKNFMVK